MTTDMTDTLPTDSVAERPKIARESEGRLQFVLEAACIGHWELDLVTHAFVASDLCLENLGLVPTGLPVTYDDIMARIHPADWLRQRQEVETALTGRVWFDVEYRVMRSDGETRWVQMRGRGIYDESGTNTHMIGVSLNITARKRAEQRQTMLLDELNHRVKNTLATVQSLAMQTQRGAKEGGGPNDQASFNRDLYGRIAALVRAHDLLTEASWEGASLSEILDRTIQAYDIAGVVSQLSAAGPAVLLAPNAAVTLNMAFHELATNAAKYGALSVPGGHVAVQWQMLDEAGTPSVNITWREEGGPAVRPPARRGFGSRLLERGLAGELGGDVTMDFAAAGLLCRIRLPLSHKVGLAA